MNIKFNISFMENDFYDGICYRVTEGSIAFIGKKQIVKTCVLGNHYYDRLLIELEEEYFFPLCDMLEFNLSTFFDQHQGVYLVDKSSSVASFLDVVEQNMQDKSRPMREQNLKLSLLQMLINSQEWKKTR